MCALVYYGISLNVNEFAGDRFVNNAASGLVEVPAQLLCVPLLFWGRKRSLVLSLLLSGATLVAVGLIPESEACPVFGHCVKLGVLGGVGWWRTALLMVGKLSITVAFTVVYVLTTELYPTPVTRPTAGTQPPRPWTRSLSRCGALDCPSPAASPASAPSPPPTSPGSTNSCPPRP